MPVTARLPEREGTCDVMSDNCAEIWLVVARVMSTLPPNPEKDPGRPAVSSHAFDPIQTEEEVPRRQGMYCTENHTRER